MGSFALQYHDGVPKAQALSALHQVFAAGEIELQGTAAEALATRGLASARPGFVDRLIHRGYVTAAQGRMVTFERAAAKLDAVRHPGALPASPGVETSSGELKSTMSGQ